MKKKKDLDSATSLYIYGNEEKLDDLLSKIYTFVVSQFELQTNKGKSFGGKIKVGLNKFLSKFGLPDIEMEFGGNLEHENIKSVVSSITFDSKMEMLKSYYKTNGRYPCINLLSGENYEYKNNKKIASDKYFNGNLVGVVLGQFAAKRIYPPVKSMILLADDVRAFDSKRMGIDSVITTPNVINDFTDNKNNLWTFYTVKDNVTQGEIPFLIGNIRAVSQYGLVKLYTQTEYPIEAIGILSWKDNVLICDPIAFKLL